MEDRRAVRRLAAILVADVVGYSRLMGEDEAGALAALNRHREHEFDPVVARHGGRIVKLMGDGTLVEFTSVVDAVDCAVAIQTAAASRASPALTLRIGVNLGDIIIQATTSTATA
jgi:adenylate cyclase